jgi:hypothetical protein
MPKKHFTEAHLWFSLLLMGVAMWLFQWVFTSFNIFNLTRNQELLITIAIPVIVVILFVFLPYSFQHKIWREVIKNENKSGFRFP